jgi:hypothetical protein
MLISPALAGHGTTGTGSTGGGTALLIILGVALVLGCLYLAQKKWRRSKLGHDGGGDEGSR